MPSNSTEIPEEEFLKWENLIYHVISKKFGWIFQDRKHFRSNPFATNTVEFGDMVQAGAVGLMRAWKSFDASSGASFKTYAYKGIFFSISTLVLREKRFVRRTRRLVGMVRNQKNFLMYSDGRRKDSDDGGDRKVFPLAVRTVVSEQTDAEVWETKEDAAVVRKKVTELVGDKRAGILFRWANGETQKEIADSMGISKQRIGQYLVESRRKVREEWQDAKLLSTT